MLRSGWTLLGDLRKFVPLSPQRFVVADADAPSATALRFQVLGSAGEAVPVDRGRAVRGGARGAGDAWARGLREAV